MPEQVHEEMIEDILEGLKIIQERSAGLEEFVNQFRKITLITEPRFETINLYSQFKRIEILYAKVFKENKIGFNYHINPETLSIYADKNMIEQLLINLLNNSIDACDKTEFKNISISAEPDEKGRIFIQINDNGKGIPVEDIDKVFIPFYTRKEGGSGIGLSLSRQIMRKHGGRINLKSQVDKGTTVMLEGILAG